MHEIHVAGSPAGKCVSFIHLCGSFLMLFLCFIFLFLFVASSMRVGPVVADIFVAEAPVDEPLSSLVPCVAIASAVAPH